MIKISPSILSANFGKLAEEIDSVKDAEMLHIDVMDGHFVPNITIGPFIVKTIRKLTDSILDVHLMIENPEKYIDAFAKAGSDIISVHTETCDDLPSVLDMIKEKGCKSGVSVNPKTDLSSVEKILDKIDMVIIMTVEPGFSGQSFMHDVVPKISDLKKMIKDQGLSTEIEVDGGIDLDTAVHVINAGADILVSGSTIFGQKDRAAMIRNLKKIGSNVINQDDKIEFG